MRSAHAGRAGGFSLVEVTIVVVVVSIAGLFLAGVFREAVTGYRLVDVEADLLQQARYASERVVREARRLRDASSVTAASTTTYAFVDRDAVPVTLTWNGTPGSEFRYGRNGVYQTLASDVDSLAFAYWTEDGTPAAPAVAPGVTDIRRVSVYVRLARDGSRVATVAAAALGPFQ